MAQSYDHVVHVRGVSIETVMSLKDREVLESIIDSGNFREVKTVPGISIYINEDNVSDPQNIMMALKNGEVVFSMNTLP